MTLEEAMKALQERANDSLNCMCQLNADTYMRGLNEGHNNAANFALRLLRQVKEAQEASND